MRVRHERWLVAALLLGAVICLMILFISVVPNVSLRIASMAH